MADITDTLKSILGDDAGDKIKSAVESLSTAEDNGAGKGLPVNADDLGRLMQLRNMVESMTMSRDDPRVNLLMSLKPYMRQGRRASVDNAVKLMGIVNLAKLIGK